MPRGRLHFVGSIDAQPVDRLRRAYDWIKATGNTRIRTFSMTALVPCPASGHYRMQLPRRTTAPDYRMRLPHFQASELRNSGQDHGNRYHRRRRTIYALNWSPVTASVQVRPQKSSRSVEGRMYDERQPVRVPAPIPVGRSCDNPECRKRLRWSGGRGRPALYCSNKCRKRAVSVTGKLVRAIQAHQRDLQSADLTYRAERAVRTELARLEWLLSMYPQSARTGAAGMSASTDATS